MVLTLARYRGIGALRYFLASDYGAVPDAYFADGAATSASATFTSATANFTAADVGKTIVILRAGPSNYQDHHTTIASIDSATQVQLSHTAGRTQSACRFYISRSGDQSTAIQAAITAATAAGGGIVMLPGVGYLVGTLTLGNRVSLRGAGMRATLLHQIAGSTTPVITNDQTANNSAMACEVRDLWVDGNRARQSNVATTLNGAYSAGSTPVTLTSTAGISPSGTLLVINATTKTITGAVSSGGLIRITATGHGFATGDMVTVAAVGGVSAANSRWTITVIDANTFDLQGSVFAGGYTSGGTAAWTVFMTYQTVSSSTVTTVEAGMHGSVDHALATGSAVTQARAGGIYFAVNPFNTNPTTAEYFDPHFLVSDVYVKNCKGEGVALWGQSETRLRNVHAHYCDDIGFHPSYDTWLADCTADTCGRMGFYMRGSSVTGTNCKAFFNGGVTAQEGHGFFFDGPTSLEEGCKVFSASASQDNKGHGVFIRNAQRVALQMSVSSNSTSNAGAFVGCMIDGGTLGIIDLLATERAATPTQLNAVHFAGVSVTPAALQLRVSFGPAAGAGSLSTAVKAGALLTGGVNLLVNGMGSYGTAAPAPAGTVTPDPYVASQLDIQMPAGNITVAAPANGHLGCELEISVIQDGTGSRTVTWNAAYKFTGATSPTLTITASRRDVFRFIYNGTSWFERSRNLNVG